MRRIHGCKLLGTGALPNEHAREMSQTSCTSGSIIVYIPLNDIASGKKVHQQYN